MGLKQDLKALNRLLASGKDNKKAAILCNQIGQYYKNQRDYKKAIEYFIKDLTYGESEDVEGTSVTYRCIGECYFGLGDYTRALENTREYLRLAQVANDGGIEEQRAYTTLANTLYDMTTESNKDKDSQDVDVEIIKSHLEEAERCYKKSLELAATIPVSERERNKMEAIGHYGLSNIAEAMGDLSTAEKESRRSIDLSRLCHAKDTQIRATIQLGLVKSRQGRPKPALEHFGEAADLAEQEGLHDWVHIALSHKAKTHVDMREYAEAIPAYKAAIKHSKLARDPHNVSILSEMLAKTINQHKAQAELTQQQAALESARDSNDKNAMMGCLETIADCYSELDMHGEAAAHYKEALEIAVDDYENSGGTFADADKVDSLYSSLAQSYMDLKMHQEAISVLEKTIELDAKVGSKANEAFAWVEMSKCLQILKKPHEESKAAAERGISLAREAGNAEFEVSAWDQLASICDEMGDHEEAERCRRKIEEGNEKLDGQSDEGEKEFLDVSSGEEEVIDEENERRVIVRRNANQLPKTNKKGETALHQAAIKGDLQMVLRAIEFGIDVNSRDNAKWTPLHEACIHGRTDIVEVLLNQSNIIIDAVGDGDFTPLHDAAGNGHAEICELLIEHGASLTAINHNNYRPLEMSDGEAKEVILRAMKERNIDTTERERHPTPPSSPRQKLATTRSRPPVALPEKMALETERLEKKYSREKRQREEDRKLSKSAVSQSEDMIVDEPISSGEEVEEGKTNLSEEPLLRPPNQKRIRPHVPVDDEEPFVVSDHDSESGMSSDDDITGSSPLDGQMSRDERLLAECFENEEEDGSEQDTEAQEARLSRGNLAANNNTSTNRLSLSSRRHTGSKPPQKKKHKSTHGNGSAPHAARQRTHRNQSASQRPRQPISTHHRTKTYTSTKIDMFFAPENEEQIQQSYDYDDGGWGDYELPSPSHYEPPPSSQPPDYENTYDEMGPTVQASQVAEGPRPIGVTVEAEGKGCSVQIQIMQAHTQPHTDGTAYPPSTPMHHLRDVISEHFQHRFGVVASVTALWAKDGSMIDDYALAGEVLTQGQVLTAVLREWTPLPLLERYPCLCSALSVPALPGVISALERSNDDTIHLEYLPLGGPPSLCYVFMGGSNANPATPLLRSLTDQKWIKKLELVSCWITDDHGPELAELLRSLPNLECLSLSGNAMTISGLSPLVEFWPCNLRTLDLSHLNLSGGHLRLSSVITKNKNTLEHLILTDCDIDDLFLESSGPLVLALCQCPLLTMSVANNRAVSVAGLAGLLRHLPPTLTDLDASGLPNMEIPACLAAPTPPPSPHLISPYLHGDTNILSSYPSSYLSSYSPTQESFVPGQWEEGTGMCLLSLAQSHAGDAGAEIIAKALLPGGMTVHVTHLNLTCCAIGPTGITAVAKTLTITPVIKSLILAGNPIGDQGAISLSQSLLANRSLTFLDLSSCNLTSKGVLGLFSCLTTGNTATSLSTLLLAANKISDTDDDFRPMITAIERLTPTLTTVDLTHSCPDGNATVQGKDGNRVLVDEGEEKRALQELGLDDMNASWFVDSDYEDDPQQGHHTASTVVDGGATENSNPHDLIQSAWRKRTNVVGGKVGPMISNQLYLSASVPDYR